MGYGTREIECFSSYMHRLATAHGMSIDMLLRIMHHVPNRNSGSIARTIKRYSPNSLGDFDRAPVKLTKFVEHLSASTGHEMAKSMTISRLVGFPRAYSELLSSSIRWCPTCLMEDFDCGQPEYFRLTWRLSAVSICRKHGVELKHQCGLCGYGQNGVRAMGSIHLCQSCKAPLRSDPNIVGVDDESSTGGYSDDLEQLIADNAHLPDLTYSPIQARKFITNIRNNEVQLEKHHRYWACQPIHGYLSQLISGEDRTIAGFRRAAYLLDIPLSTLLSGSPGQWTPEFDHEWRWVLPESLRDSSPHVLLEKEKVSELLKIASIEDPYGRPYSLHQIADSLGITSEAISCLVPSQAKTIQKRYSNWLRSDIKRQKIAIKLEALKYLNNYYVDETLPAAVQFVSQRTGLSKRMITGVINKEMKNTVVGWRLSD